MVKNYYVILGVTEDATLGEVKSAYRRLVKEHHPDYSGREAEPFLRLQEAYAVLGDPARRSDYDRGLRETRVRRPRPGAEPTRTRHAPDIEPIVPEWQPADLGTASLSRSFQAHRPTWEELFDRLWSNFRPGPRPKEETVQSLTAVVQVTPEQAFRGGTVRIGVPAQAHCPTCRGQGGVGPYECWRCGGTGTEVGEMPVLLHFPAQIPDDYAVQVPLDRYGIHNLHLIVRFRVSEWI